MSEEAHTVTPNKVRFIPSHHQKTPLITEDARFNVKGKRVQIKQDKRTFSVKVIKDAEYLIVHGSDGKVKILPDNAPKWLENPNKEAEKAFWSLGFDMKTFPEGRKVILTKPSLFMDALMQLAAQKENQDTKIDIVAGNGFTCAFAQLNGWNKAVPFLVGIDPNARIDLKEIHDEVTPWLKK
tara:strand:+ start:2340 stop:2885 length:546 start_codon:yes stop_codon:yes gene_type:complete